MSALDVFTIRFAAVSSSQTKSSRRQLGVGIAMRYMCSKTSTYHDSRGTQKMLSGCLSIASLLCVGWGLLLPLYSSAKDLAGGELVVRIGIPQNSSASLCVKNRCYPVGNVTFTGEGAIACPADTCFCTWAAADELYECVFREYGVDHPIVDFPDDWDEMSLTQSEGHNVDAGELTVTYAVDYTTPNAGCLVSPHTYVFVDSTNADGLGTTLGSSYRIYSGRTNWLRDEVDFRREKTMEALAGVNFDQLPWMVQMAAYDIGQAGIVKYKLGEHATQNGCDEFYAYFGALYSNNILAPPGVHASYFPYDKGVWKGAWSRAGRLVEVQWANRVDAAGGCNYPTLVREGTNDNYIPRAGDYLFRGDNRSILYNYLSTSEGFDCKSVVSSGAPADALACCNQLGTTDTSGNWSVSSSSHVMMLVDGQGFVPTGVPGDFEINILQKSDMVETAQLRVNADFNASPGHSNWPCYRVCGAYVANNGIVLPGGVTDFRWDFYIGIADHELGGADPADRNAPVNFGFIAAAPGFMF